EVTNQREVVERAQGHRAPRQPGEEGTASPALASVDDHGAGAAHADPAGVAEGQGGIGAALHLDEGIEHGHALARAHPVLLHTLARAGPPAEDLQNHRHFQKRAKAAIPTSRASRKRARCHRAGSPKSRRMERIPSTPWSSTRPSSVACTGRMNGFLRCITITPRSPTAATRWRSQAHMP